MFKVVRSFLDRNDAAKADELMAAYAAKTKKYTDKWLRAREKGEEDLIRTMVTAPSHMAVRMVDYFRWTGDYAMFRALRHYQTQGHPGTMRRYGRFASKKAFCRAYGDIDKAWELFQRGDLRFRALICDFEGREEETLYPMIEEGVRTYEDLVRFKRYETPEWCDSHELLRWILCLTELKQYEFAGNLLKVSRRRATEKRRPAIRGDEPSPETLRIPTQIVDWYWQARSSEDPETARRCGAKALLLDLEDTVANFTVGHYRYLWEVDSSATAVSVDLDPETTRELCRIEVDGFYASHYLALFTAARLNAWLRPWREVSRITPKRLREIVDWTDWIS